MIDSMGNKLSPGNRLYSSRSKGNHGLLCVSIGSSFGMFKKHRTKDKFKLTRAQMKLSTWVRSDKIQEIVEAKRLDRNQAK